MSYFLTPYDRLLQSPDGDISIIVNMTVFLGVLFALKVLSNHYHPGGVTYVMGFPVSNRYVSWVELVLIHMTSPG